MHAYQTRENEQNRLNKQNERLGSDSSSGEWLSILDYASRFDISLSTLRRHIKSGKIQYRSERGKYYLLVGSLSKKGAPLPSATKDSNDSSQIQSLMERISDLENKLMSADEQIAELKMLVSIYESQIEGSSTNLNHSSIQNTADDFDKDATPHQTSKVNV